MIENLYGCFCTKTQYSLVLDNRGVREEVCVCMGGGMGGNFSYCIPLNFIK